MAEHSHEAILQDDIITCTVHPDRETRLHCNKCGRSMCTECAVQTPVGYRCRECVRTQQDKFFSAMPTDYLITFGVALAISVVLGFLARSFSGFFFLIIYIILVGPAVGSFIAQAVLRLTGKRRGRYSGIFMVAGIVVGFLVPQWQIIRYLFMGMSLGAAVSYLLWPLIYAAVTASVAFGWTRFGGPKI